MEININIEGYNVNGICVGCLNYNRKMFYNEDVKDFFKIWANIDVPDGLSVQVCWECLAAVRSAVRFRTQVLSAFNILMDYSRKHTFLNSPNDLTKHAVSRLSARNLPLEPSLVILKQEPPHIDVDVIKVEEEEPKYDVHEFESHSPDAQFLNPQSPKEEDRIDGFIDTDFLDDLQSQDQDGSEDDIQLSKLKAKKKKGRKSKKERNKRKQKEILEEKEVDQPKRSRKLKNLPEDLVELYTMTEEEMWRIRAEDVARKEFVALKYKCENCIIGFNTEKLMNYHMNGKHLPKSEDNVQCDVCKAYFVTRDNMSAHRALHLAAYRCRSCGAATSLKPAMLAHACTSRSAPTLACSTCGKEFTTKSKLTYHRGVCHQERPQCDCCGKVFANKMTLKYHLKILPQNKPKEKLHIPCKGCDKVFFSKKSYRAHVVIHNGLTYPCPICGKLFQWKRNLARHTRNHRERDAGALHECRDCGKSFSSRDCYNNHMRLSKRHVPEDAYIHACNYCGKKFATKWCMVDHIDWDHLKLIKYQCSVCFKPFKTAKIMVAHMNNIHEGRKNKEPEGEHLCEICGKSYKTVKRLKGHVWAMHTKRSASKSFKCKLCPATFTWQTSIYKHMKMMHDICKRTKQTRSIPAVKKQEPYPEIDLANRMQYFQQNLANNLVQNMVQAQPPPLNIVQNIV
ncbi:zinc finger protein 624-like [Battus philenor]|uniref:zinc finger protein 624-like n=1 Tax=Battus philenor TaxID=42288 RepID=UPI0035D0162A